ncbi:AraC family transcriptional regulator [Deinococcus roseus]|uniref:AraC family transcriptional regulator n=1 Tax=Deinococcus roseus TaxID=392414 RepID=A0ABQ2D2X3_9DEIO|nr:AraC family transcriptional regulator [Deinococcus roseus]GGJ43887.1 AraC family transcriptional regulator [Deinococcus roseus]
MEVEAHQNSAQALTDQVLRRTGWAEDVTTLWPALTLHRRVRPTPEAPCLYQPNVTVVLSGQKRVVLAVEQFLMTPGHFLLTSANLPVTPQIVEASPNHPFLAVMLMLDLNALAAFLLNHDLPAPSKRPSQRAIALGATSPELLDAFRRLVALLDTPGDLPVLAPLIEQEILYRLLCTPQGERLRDMAAASGHSHRLSRALRWLERHFRDPLNITDLAEHVGMSPSAFHRLFKDITAMSPLQYQKTLRLSEAQRLMLTQDMDAARAAFEVGYVSPSQFSREYRRQFGVSPISHVATLRETD